MKKISLLILLVVTIQADAQNNNYLVSTEGIGAIKLGMSHEELEKLLNKKILLTNPSDTSGSWMDSAFIQYKNVAFRIEFTRTYTAENTFYMRITTIETSSVLCKTKSGIGIGSDKLKIVMAYEENPVIIMPDYNGDSYSTPSKTRSIITIRNNEFDKKMSFMLFNRKVTRIQVNVDYNDAE